MSTFSDSCVGMAKCYGKKLAKSRVLELDIVGNDGEDDTG